MTALFLLGRGLWTAPEVETEEERRADQIRTLLSAMTLQEKAAQLFILTPEALADGGSQNWPVGGLIYFTRNIITPEEQRQATAAAQARSMERIGIPLFLGIDEEGGEITRIAGNPAFNVPTFGRLKDIRTGEEAYQLGDALGTYLADYGFNMDFAPVADVLTNPKNTVVRNRAFSSDPEIAATLVEEELRGFGAHPVLPVLKHFPGHGNTTGDTHDGYAYTDKTLDELRACEFIPFERGIAAGARIVMIGHISAPAVLGDDTPSSLSGTMIGEILRKELGFRGVVITDALNMAAITSHYDSAEAAILALKAGSDLLLMPEDFQTAYLGVLDAVGRGEITEERIDESLARVLDLKLETLNW